MFPSIDPQNGIPIFEQVCRQVKFAIAQGAYHSGEMLPSVREMSKKTAVNPNTVARSYPDLQREGIIEAVRGTGMQVTSNASSLCKKERKRLIQERISSVLQEACASQVSQGDIQNWLDKEVHRLWK